MPKLPIIKSRELIKALLEMGFMEFHRVGSHAQFKHPQDGRRITIPIHSGKDIKRKTLKSILDDLEISTEQFTRLLKKDKSHR